MPTMRNNNAHYRGPAGIKSVRAKVENPNILAECSKSFCDYSNRKKLRYLFLLRKQRFLVFRIFGETIITFITVF